MTQNTLRDAKTTILTPKWYTSSSLFYIHVPRVSFIFFLTKYFILILAFFTDIIFAKTRTSLVKH